MVFDVVSENVKDWFRLCGEGEVEELVKVTVQRTSYTVLLIYFFRDGIIYILHNKLMGMTARGRPGQWWTPWWAPSASAGTHSPKSSSTSPMSMTGCTEQKVS